MQITKRNGRVVLFDNDKIAGSILKANEGIAGESVFEFMAQDMAQEVFHRVTAESDIITTSDVQRAVFALLIERGLPKTAENYKTFGENK